MPIVLVERSFPTPVEVDPEAFRRAQPCYAARRVEHLRSYLSPDKMRMICVYRAPDAASVREANDIGQQPYDRVWSAGTLGPDGLPGPEE